MYTGHQKTQWEHTTHLLTTIHNVHRTSKDQKALTFDEIYPFGEKQKPKPATRDELKAVFMGALQAMGGANG